MPANLTRIVPRGGEPGLLAVAVCHGPHAGIVYLGAGGRLELLHFAWHGDLRQEAYRPNYVCVELNLLRAEGVALAGYCRKIYSANAQRNTIPYNLRYDEGTRFDPATGELVLPAGATGMNCATFVLHVFRSAGAPLIDASGWPARLSDRPRQEGLVATLGGSPDPGQRSQAALISPEVGCPRIRPEEVVGAALEDTLPATFDHCEPNGRLMGALLDSWCGRRN
jgi:hypothetical protein